MLNAVPNWRAKVNFCTSKTFASTILHVPPMSYVFRFSLYCILTCILYELVWFTSTSHKQVCYLLSTSTSKPSQQKIYIFACQLRFSFVINYSLPYYAFITQHIYSRAIYVPF